MDIAKVVLYPMAAMLQFFLAFQQPKEAPMLVVVGIGLTSMAIMELRRLIKGEKD